MIKGKDGMVNVPKGTFVQIFNYSRHLNTELWGEDAEDFNPMRELKIMKYGIMKAMLFLIRQAKDFLLK